MLESSGPPYPYGMNVILPLALTAATLVASAALPRVTFDARPLGLPATTRALPAERRGEDSPVFFPPAHVRATFGVQDGQALRELNVYPVAGLLAQYPGRREGVRTEVDGLRALLKARPAPREVRGDLPFLPLPFAGQVLHGAVKYVDFQGGRGVRYLVAFSQEVAPLTRAQVFYTFQGLTNDGRQYVSFQYDLPLRELPQDDADADAKRVNDALYSGDSARADAAWKAYVTRTARTLDAVTDDARLTRLDRFVASVRVR